MLQDPFATLGVLKADVVKRQPPGDIVSRHHAIRCRRCEFRGFFQQVEHAGYELPSDWSAYEPYQSEINLSEVSEDAIFRLRKTAYRRFYFNPKRMWRLFKSIPNKANMLPFLTLLFARRAYAR